jgi:hypothetical protein
METRRGRRAMVALACELALIVVLELVATAPLG